MNDAWKDFLKVCAQVDDPKLFGEFLELFLTHEERKDLAGRFALVKALLEGKRTQRQIAEELGVSIAKITRGSNALKVASKNVKEILE